MTEGRDWVEHTRTRTSDYVSTVGSTIRVGSGEGTKMSCRGFSTNSP